MAALDDVSPEALAAVPVMYVDGKANAAVIEAVAEAFGVRRAAVSIVRGETGRRKTLHIAGIGSDALARLGFPV